MVNGEKNNQSSSDRNVDDDVERCRDDRQIEGSESDGANRGSTGLAERLTEILVEDSDGDLLLQRSDREGSVLQWLQALDLQVIGACRADERLKPLLKMNVSSGAAEDCLLAYLTQHFDPAEVGMLARCLCIPLVSVRVGKIKKQGTQLCPTSTRGNLSLSLLPTSDLRISFIGDDGSTDRLATLCSTFDCSTVEIDGISADQSGRSFLVKIPDGEIFYFWCSEKSKLLGDEMLRKMKDLLRKKPSLSELTGINESRLKCFAIHLRAHLIGSTNSMLSTTPLSDSSIGSSSVGPSTQPASSQKTTRQKSIPFHQGGLGARSSSFKESSASSLRNIVRDKLRKRGENSAVVNVITKETSSSTCVKGKASEESVFHTKVSEPSLAVDPPFRCPASTVPCSDSTLVLPYYCWCPPPVSVGTPQLPILSTEPLSLPPITSLSMMPKPPSMLFASPKQPFNLADMSSLDLPPLLPDPLVRLPLTLPVSSQQIPTFTPLICDPIVHIPIIDVCSSGQGYLVSAGPAMSTAIPPLHPLIPNAESVVEKSARETLRLLMNSSNQSNAPLMSVLPSFLPPNSENTLSMIAAAGGSRGLYSGTIDVSGERSVGEKSLVEPVEMPISDSVVFSDGFSNSLDGKGSDSGA